MPKSATKDALFEFPCKFGGCGTTETGVHGIGVKIPIKGVKNLNHFHRKLIGKRLDIVLMVVSSDIDDGQQTVVDDLEPTLRGAYDVKSAGLLPNQISIRLVSPGDSHKDLEEFCGKSGKIAIMAAESITKAKAGKGAVGGDDGEGGEDEEEEGDEE